MKKLLVNLLCFCFLFHFSYAQIYPHEQAELNFRLIGFRYRLEENARHVQLEIARGSLNTEDSFLFNICTTIECAADSVIAEVPEFGKNYTWRLRYQTGVNQWERSPFHHFSTLSFSSVDTSKFRLRVTQTASAYKDAYVFLDGTAALCDMKGNPVWFLPEFSGGMNEQITDLKMTDAGTITYISGDKSIFEINFKGDILWKGPENGDPDRDRHYHHEFSRLRGGNLMALRTEPVEWTANATNEKTAGLYKLKVAKFGVNSIDTHTFPFSLLTQYDRSGKITWEWSFLDYFNKSDLFKNCPPGLKNSFDAHPNSFYFDEKHHVIYLSLRNINRILEIDYPSGKVIHTYGEIFDHAKNSDKNIPEFRGQHSCKVTDGRVLYMYNNNVNDTNSHPEVLMYKLPEGSGKYLNEIWRYSFPLETLNGREFMSVGFTRGGNVEALSDSLVFVSMASPYSQMFILSKDKQIEWSAIAEVWNAVKKEWEMLPQYRVSIIPSRAQLEKMIWASDPKQ